jgi:hypothetical protein
MLSDHLIGYALVTSCSVVLVKIGVLRYVTSPACSQRTTCSTATARLSVPYEVVHGQRIDDHLSDFTTSSVDPYGR